MPWLILGTAGILEVARAVGLKYSVGIARPLLTLRPVVAAIASMWFPKYLYVPAPCRHGVQRLKRHRRCRYCEIGSVIGAQLFCGGRKTGGVRRRLHGN